MAAGKSPRMGSPEATWQYSNESATLIAKGEESFVTQRFEILLDGRWVGIVLR